MNAESPAQLVVKRFQPQPGDAYSRLLAPLQNEGSREVLIELEDGFTVERWTLSEAEKREVANRSHIVDVIEEGYAMRPTPIGVVGASASLDLEDALKWHEVQFLHDAGAKGKGQIIAVLDTGISRELYEKLEAEGRMAGAVSFISGESQWDEGGEAGHGTFCCEAAATMAPEAKILSIKVLSSEEGWGYTSSIIKGYDHARANGATVATASLGGPGEPRDAMCRTLDAVSQSGVICLSAAGNEQRGSSEYKADKSHPACAAESATIAAFDSDGELAGFSNWGKCVRLGALGVKVYQGGRDWSGTSMATPFAAGIAACVRGVKAPQLSVEETKKVMYSSALDTVYDVWKEGYGLTNGELIADKLDLLDLPEGYYPELPRTSMTRYATGGYKQNCVVTYRRKEVAVSYPKPEGL